MGHDGAGTAQHAQLDPRPRDELGAAGQQAEDEAGAGRLHLDLERAQRQAARQRARETDGERQRLTIARLLLARPRVVILDEATAHLDSESEAAVQQALKVALAGRTSLVIAHRLSTIREADQILVVQDGRVVERGRHEELLARGAVYAELYRTQFSQSS